MGWGGVVGFEGGGVGAMIKNKSPDFRFAEVGISDLGPPIFRIATQLYLEHYFLTVLW